MRRIPVVRDARIWLLVPSLLTASLLAYISASLLKPSGTVNEIVEIRELSQIANRRPFGRVTAQFNAVHAVMRLENKVDIIDSKVFRPREGVSYYDTSFQTEACGIAACNGKGQCFLGRCFCYPGATGRDCNIGEQRDCSNIAELVDRLECFRHELYGVAVVDRTTWLNALDFERQGWATSRDKDDRAAEHAEGYDYFKALGNGVDFGAVAEFGCGPWTQFKTCVAPALLKRKMYFRLESVTLLEPNLINYMQQVGSCAYEAGTLIPGVPTFLVAAGAEVKLFHNQFDTLVMSNVLEHVQNAYDILQNVYDALKPGGLLIFHDRWWPDFDFSQADPVNNKFHPIRLHKPVFDWFTSKLEVLYENYEGTTAMKERGESGLYLIARKP